MQSGDDIGVDLADIGVDLADAIATVRSELERAIAEGQGSTLAFRAGPIELEFEVAFSAKGTAGGGVRAWVVSAEASGERARAQTHRLKVSLTPVWRDDGTDPLIGSLGER